MNNMRKSRAICQIVCFLPFGLLVLAFLSCTPAHPASSSVKDEIKTNKTYCLPQAYVDMKKRELLLISRRLSTNTPCEFEPFFSAVVDSNWAMATSIYDSLRPAWESDSLWTPVHDVFWSHVESQKWSEDLLRMYTDDVRASARGDSILLTGTDAGRFLVPMVSAADGLSRPAIVSLNALVAPSYLRHLAATSPVSLSVPGEDFLRSATARVGALSQLAFESNAVTAAQLLMRVNGLVAREMFDTNRGKESFYVDEGYQIDWMLPYLMPCDLLMRLSPCVVTNLTRSQVDADFDYWNRKVHKLCAMPSFRTCAVAQATYAKLRSSIAGIYGYRELYFEAEKALRQALEMCPSSFDAHARLLYVFCIQDRYQDAKSLIDNYGRISGRKPDVDRLQQFFDWHERVSIRQKELERHTASGDISLFERCELAQIYHTRGKFKEFQGTLERLLRSIEIPAEQYRWIVSLCAQTDKMPLLLDKSEEAAARDQRGRLALLNLATAYLLFNQSEKALATLQEGVRLYGQDFIDKIKADKRLDSIRGRIGSTIKGAESIDIIPSSESAGR